MSSQPIWCSIKCSAIGLDAKTAKLTPNDPPFAKSPSGAGPRHLTFHPNGKRVYVINELANSVTVFDYDMQSGKLTETQTTSTVQRTSKGPAIAPT